MKLSVGDKIYVTDERLEGKLISFNEDCIIMECPDGFEYTFPIEKIYKINEQGDVENRPKAAIESKKYKSEGSINNLQSKSVHLTFNSKNTVVDLHLEVLQPHDHRMFSDSEALDFQLNIVQELIREANRKRIRKFVLVHGVGKGKLRREIRKLLEESYPGIEYLDGNYQKFGGGATELIIHQFD